MEQSLFNINSYIVNLSAPAAYSTLSTYLTAVLRGPTRVHINYSQLNLTVLPFKATIDWNGSTDKTYINTNFSTTAPLNSAESVYTFTPTQIDPQYNQTQVLVYYENGVVHTHNILFVLNSYNVIDLDLNVIDVQNVNSPLKNILNIESNTEQIVFNVTG